MRCSLGASRNALNNLSNICQMLLLSSPSQEENGICRGVFCLGIFQIVAYAHIYMSASVYVREDKVIEIYLYCWRCKLLCENPSLGSLLWAWSWLGPEESAFSSIDKPDLHGSWAVGCCLGLGPSVSYRCGGLDGCSGARYPNLVNYGNMRGGKAFSNDFLNLVNTVNRKDQKLQRGL